jgi:hypothetical protein
MVSISDGCWLWSGAVRDKGRPGGSYGAFVVCRCGQYRTYRANRIAYQLVNGPIPDGLWVLHRCDVRLCVRPSHLFLGTAKDNTLDALAKGRLACGLRGAA